MRVPSHPTQIRRMLDGRLKQMVPTGPVLAASLTRVNKRCGQPSCRCHHGGPLHQAHHLTFRQGARHAPSTCPRTSSRRSNNGCKNTNASRPCIHEVSQLTLALIRGHVQDRRRRGDDAEHRPHPGADHPPLLPRSQRLDRSDPTTPGSCRWWSTTSGSWCGGG